MNDPLVFLNLAQRAAGSGRHISQARHEIVAEGRKSCDAKNVRMNEEVAQGGMLSCRIFDLISRIWDSIFLISYLVFGISYLGSRIWDLVFGISYLGFRI